jgi:hypothetical protein
MKKLPFKQQKIADKLIREFSPYADLDELKWHRDTTNRDVKIIQGGGWKFQSWDELPKTLKNEDKLYIPRGTWHRVLRGDEPLIIEIYES